VLTWGFAKTRDLLSTWQFHHEKVLSKGVISGARGLLAFFTDTDA
jgi:hypothetical protein